MGVNNSVQINSSNGVVGESFPALTLSAAGSNRTLWIFNLSKYNSLPVGTTAAIVVDSAGVNATIANGKVVSVGVDQVAVEGSFSNIKEAYRVLDANLPVGAGSIVIDTTLDLAPNYSHWVAVEITGYQDAIDATTEVSDLVDVAAGIDFNLSVTTTVPNCLVLDMWALSHSSIPTRTANQNLIQFGAHGNGSFMASWVIKTLTGAQVMTENVSTLHQRRAGMWISLAPVVTVSNKVKLINGGLINSGLIQ